MVARCVRDAKVVGSNPVASTKTAVSPMVLRLFLILRLATGFEGGSRFAGAKRFALRNLDYKKNLTAKDDVDNVGAGRAAKGENPVASTIRKAKV